MWRKSSFCNGASTCVEVLPMPDLDVVAVRDSKHPEQEPLVFSLAEWSAFTAGVRSGEFDYPARDAVGRFGREWPGAGL